MAEIRSSPIHGQGLFAKQKYKAGDVIVDSLYRSQYEHCINASEVLDDIPSDASYQQFLNVITSYNVSSVQSANVTRHERYDDRFQILHSYLVALRDIRKDEELLDTYPALVWLNQRGQTGNADRYIYEVYKEGHPNLHPNASMQRQVSANYAARTFANIIYLGSLRENNPLLQQLIMPFVVHYLKRQLSSGTS